MCVMCSRQIWIYQHHSDVFIMNSIFSIRQLIHIIFIIHATDREYIIFNTSLISFFLIYNFLVFIVVVVVVLSLFCATFSCGIHIFTQFFYHFVQYQWLCLNINSALHCIWLRYDFIIIFKEKWKLKTENTLHIQTAQYGIFTRIRCKTCLFFNFILCFSLLGIKTSISLRCDVIMK